MRVIGVVGIASAVVVVASAPAALPARAQAPDPPSAWLYDQSDRVIDVAGCALECFDLVYAHSTPAYYSFDTPRNVTLVYNSRTAYPRPFVIVDAQASTGILPDMLSIELKVLRPPPFGWVNYQPLDGSAPIFYRYADASRPVARMKFPFDGSGLATGRYQIQAEVRAWSGGVSSVPIVVTGYVLVVNELNSAFGSGWNIAGLQRIHVSPDGYEVVITEGDGSAVHFYRFCLGCAWIAPDGEFTTLTHSPGSGYSRMYPDGSEVFFTEDGHMAWIRDRHWNTAVFAWTSGNLTAISDPAGKQITLSYTNGMLQSITDPGGRATNLSYSGTNLQRITFAPDGSYEEFGYGVAPYWDRLMSFSRSKSGQYTDYGYGYGRHLQVTTFPAVAIADSAGPVRPRFAQQSIGNMVDAMLLEGMGTSNNPAPLMLAIHGPYYHDARNNRTSFGVDRFGAYTSIGHWVPEAGGHNATQIFRNQHSQPVRVITPRGAETEYFWTAFKLDSIRNSHSGQRIRFRYTSPFADIDSIGGDIASVRNFWTAGRLDSTRLGPNVSQSPRTRFTYDYRGRVIRTTQPVGDGTEVVTEYVYGRANPWENLDTVKIGPRNIVYQYDSYGRVSSVRDPELNLVQTSYDARNRPGQQIGMHADTTLITYDDAALKTYVLDAKGQLYDMTYNALGWLVSRTDASGLSDLYAYDLNGNLARWTNRRGQTTSLAYDVLNRVTSRSTAGSVTSYAADSFDRFISTSTAVSTDTIYFDIQGRDSLAVSVRSLFPYRVVKFYDVRGRLWQQNVTSPSDGGNVAYSYDNNYDRLSSMNGPHGNISFGYNALGQLTTTTYPTTPSPTVLSEAYSSAGARGRLTPPVALLQQLYVQDYNARAKESYAPDESTKKLYFHDGVELTGYRVEDIAGLQCSPDFHFGNACTHSTLGWIRGEDLTFDAVGNTVQAGVWDQASYLSTSTSLLLGNRLTGMWGYVMEYDADGNMTSRANSEETRLLYWSAIGQLDSVQIGGQVFRYEYDGWGRRVGKKVGSVHTRFIWDGSQIILESGAFHNVEGRYGLAGPRPLYLRRGTDTRYFVQQNGGTVSGMFTRSLQVTHVYDYHAFGKRLGFDAPESFHNPLRFAGQYFDSETGMYYLRARYYDPALYRFISEDPTGLAGGVNPYAYADNDPVNFSDPSGLIPRGVCFGPVPGSCASPLPPLGFAPPSATATTPDARRIVRRALRLVSVVWDKLTDDSHWCEMNGLPRGCTHDPILENIGPGAALKAASGVMWFTRFGKTAETAASLAEQAAAAERTAIGIHGVSVWAGRLTRHPGSHATREAIENAGFELVRTGRRGHYTIPLPKPVTDAIARAWNALWGLQ